jgi:hypothetical protein
MPPLAIHIAQLGACNPLVHFCQPPKNDHLYPQKDILTIWLASLDDRFRCRQVMFEYIPERSSTGKKVT